MSSREQFEAWFVAKHGPSVLGDHTLTFVHRRGDEYTFSPAQNAWVVWQASRAVVVVELPDIKNTFYPNSTERARADEAVWWCKNNIEAAGLKVAP